MVPVWSRGWGFVMKRFGQVLLVTLVRGILFLVPIVLVAVLAREGYQFLVKLFQPLTAWLQADRVFGLLAEDVMAILALTLVFLVAGLFVGTRSGRVMSDRLERTILYRVPGYLMARGVAGGFPGLEMGSAFAPVLVQLDDGWAFALLVERQPEGFCTVFLPSAPSPTSGDVRIVGADRVRPLEVSMLALLGCLTRSGSGGGALAARVLADQVHRQS